MLPEPEAALRELTRVCKVGGKLIIPTYIEGDKRTNKPAVKLLEKIGANFSNRFDEASYKRFFEEMGYDDVTFEIVRGRMSCAIAVVNVNK